MKVHFAGTPGDEIYMSRAGARYCLFSHHYLKAKANSKSTVDFMNSCPHAILDSGIFTMMFGSDSHKKFTEQDIIEAHNIYADWIKKSGYKHSVVEFDIQKILGAKFAWELRRQLKKKIKNPIINVYHLEDGSPDELIKFSDYIAVGMPELRKCVSRKELLAVGDYILKKSKAKGIRCHMLGCTSKDLMKRWRDSYSCDSTSWKQMTQYNNLKITGDTFKKLDKEMIYEFHKKGKFKDQTKSTTAYYYSLKAMLLEYETWAGDQT